MRIPATILLLLACRDSAAAPERGCKPGVLRVASVAPQRGEKLSYEESVRIDIASPAQGRVTGENRFATKETVTAVRDGMIDELEVRFNTGTVRLPGKDATIDVSGKTYKLRFESGALVYLEGDRNATADAVTALRAYQRNDVGDRHWLSTLLIDRELTRGVELHLSADKARGMGNKPTAVWLVLRDVKDGLATFSIKLAARPDLPFVTEGQVILRLANARLVSAELRSVMDASRVPHGTSGTVTVKQRYEYDGAGTAKTTWCP